MVSREKVCNSEALALWSFSSCSISTTSCFFDWTSVLALPDWWKALPFSIEIDLRAAIFFFIDHTNRPSSVVTAITSGDVWLFHVDMRVSFQAVCKYRNRPLCMGGALLLVDDCVSHVILDTWLPPSFLLCIEKIRETGEFKYARIYSWQYK